jgi:endonuclease YncB( thermonuclease family)
VIIPRFYRRHPILTAAMGLFALGAVIDHGLVRHQADDSSRYQGRIFTVARIVGVNAIEIECPDLGASTTRVRLWGITAEGEMRSGAKEKHGFQAGIQTGQQVRLELAPTRTRDTRGNLLAYVYSLPEDESYNERLLRDGIAAADAEFSHPLLLRFGRIAENARRRGMGRWSEEFAAAGPR